MSNPAGSEKTIFGVVPFGYRRQGNTLLPDESEAPLKKLIYELFLTHQRKKTVARLLNEAGYRTRSGALFSDSAVERLLRDTSSKGIFEINQNGKIKEIKLEPIVSLVLWEQVNSILDREKKPLKKTVNLFAGIVFCQCGGKMNVPSNSPKYVCENCRHKIGTFDLEVIFQEQLKQFPCGMPENSPETLYDFWHSFTKDEKKTVVENLIERIVIGKGDIHIEFGISPNSFKTMVFGQQDKEILDKAEKQSESNTIIESETSQPTNLTDPLMSEIEAAKFLGISRMNLLRKRNDGQVKFFRVGFRVLYSKEKHLLPFLDECEQKAEKE